MKKQLLFIVLCLCLQALSLHASNDTILIDLDKNHPEQTIERFFYDITVSRVNVDSNGIVTLSISIYNKSSNDLYLFEKNYSKRELRRDHRIIVNNYNCEYLLETTCCEFINSTFSIEPQQQYVLGQIQISEDLQKTILIPVYVTKLKGSICNRREIINWDPLQLAVFVNSNPDPYYYDIEHQCDSLIDIISQQHFCRHQLHNPKLEKQEEPFKKEIERLSRFCKNRQNKLPKESKYCQKYEDLIERLGNIDFSEYEIDDCGDVKAHSKPAISHSHCKYCDMKFEQINEELDVLWWKLDNGTVTKENAVKEVNKILNCCKYSSKHASDWKSGKTKFKRSIEESCKRIKNYKAQ